MPLYALTLMYFVRIFRVRKIIASISFGNILPFVLSEQNNSALLYYSEYTIQYCPPPTRSFRVAKPLRRIRSCIKFTSFLVHTSSCVRVQPVHFSSSTAGRLSAQHKSFTYACVRFTVVQSAYRFVARMFASCCVYACCV